MIILDIWMLANIIYSEANNIWIDWRVILNADQIRGFEDSILSYLSWSYLAFPLITAITIYLLFMFHTKEDKSWKRPWKTFLLVSGCAICLYAFSWGIRTVCIEETWTPIRKKKAIIKTHSPVMHLFIVGKEAMMEDILKRNASKPLTTKEKIVISSILTNPTVPNSPKGHLVYILVESFESWALKATDTAGLLVCPNLNRYIHEHSVLFSDNVISQQLYGRSGDGQLITQTGMLPVSHDITCMRYGENRYPNLAHFYPDGVILNPFPKVWNQAVTTYSYGFQRLREPSAIHVRENDSTIFKQAYEELENASVPTCVLAITINTHVPFTSVPATMDLDESYSHTENLYLQCARYFDTQIGRFLAWADTATTMEDATIVITADHNHFPRKNGKGVCPLIIHSPVISHTIYVPDAYQIDIFPTVLHAIGQTNYAWHGFGIDLLDSTAVRTISPEQAYTLSDKMIRTDYFNHIE